MGAVLAAAMMATPPGSRGPAMQMQPPRSKRPTKTRGRPADNDAGEQTRRERQIERGVLQSNAALCDELQAKRIERAARKAAR